MKPKIISQTTGGLKLSTMKKLVILLLISIPIFTFAQTTTWDYPVKPGSEGWKMLNSRKAKLEMCQIPDDILKKIPTYELMEICFNYPLIHEIFAFNSTATGINQLKNNFNGFREFIKRDGAAQLLIKRYSKLQPNTFQKNWSDVEKGHFSLDFIYTELFLSQNEILNRLTLDRKKELGKELIKKFDGKSDKELYGRLSQMSIAFSLARLMNSAKYELNIAEPDIRNKVETFAKNGNLRNTNLLPQLLTNAKEFIK